MKLSNKWTDRFDWTLAFYLVLFFIVSLTAIASAQISGPHNTNFALLQVRWYVLGAFIVFMMIQLEPQAYKKLAWPLYGFGIFLLLFLMFAPGGEGQIAETRLGAKRWLHLPVIGTIQPSEFIKTFFILGLARMVSLHNENNLERTLKTDTLLLAKAGVMLIVPLAFIMKQPDLGTSLVFIAITAAVIITSGISWKLLAPIMAVGASAGATLLWMAVYAQDSLVRLGFDPYQFKRVYSWLDPYSYPGEEGYNLIQAMTAIGSGEFTGKGFRESVVYIPENHTDFIISVIGEEWGFVGTSLLITLFFVFIYHLTKIALTLKDPFSVYITAGVIAMIGFHVLENIGMNIQLLPITGIPLPFVSYGGSSLFSNMFAIGLVFSMRFHQQDFHFEAEEA
ncbi:FtsW/RodA/SpoVE family cell cycle protein [Sporosarcina trichiuri]|uniref:FtsW/RodA/SpoVE family cell cycle protein n=1 Tax=Sporosarcina trichiuri TaxID=3056445 RepID=UPI0025B4F2D8|nr:FtsW/RodA/SpoVE family cell cycle protein [Sporosarcina sp. 0.2-SM1T-5]WJY27163.1 FtsW/RodA/SpoVE family cell cycle protein [Sporosarcina sp. 0.2-SM1T-5]